MLTHKTHGFDVYVIEHDEMLAEGTIGAFLESMMQLYTVEVMGLIFFKSQASATCIISTTV